MELYARTEKYATRCMTDQLPIRELMSKPVAIIHYSCSLAEAAHMMVSRRISGLPVVDDLKRLVGVITEADFLRALGVPHHHPAQGLWQTLEMMFSHEVQVREPKEKLSELMVTDVVTASPDQTLYDVLELMKNNRIKRVIVCNEAMHVVGMVTRSDLVRVFFDRITQAQEHEN